MNKRNGMCGAASTRLAVHDTMRRLWIEHVLFTRAFIISAAFELPDLDVTTNRLLRNPVDFAEALRPFLNMRDTAKFQKLLTEHLAIAGELVNAAKAGDTEMIDQKRREWYANADEIAAFLGMANPCWREGRWRALLYDHLKMTENEAVYILKGKYQAGIDQYDAIQREALEMADYLTCCIVGQV